jgi:MFS family permease
MTTTTQNTPLARSAGGRGPNEQAETSSLRADVRVLGPVGGAHFLSHYLIFLLPPILPLMKVEFGVGYAALGLIMTVFNVASGLTHVPMGFLVDRFGARRLLLCGVVVSTVVYVSMGAFAGYGAMLVLAAVAGVANSVYHPADYALLSASIAPRRMGRAFSLHTFAGFAGGAMAPMVMAYVSIEWGWRVGMMLTGIIGLAVLLPLIINRRYLSDGDAAHATAPNADVAPEKTVEAIASGPSRKVDKTGIALLLSMPIVMCNGPWRHFWWAAPWVCYLAAISPTAPGIMNGWPWPDFW